jgi:DNA-binding response OmpR family regulator
MNTRSRRILIVDDDPEIRKSLTHVLTRQGFTVAAAENAATALAAVAAEAPDIVLTDLYMRGSDGLDLISALRDGARNIPIVAMSGEAGSDIMISARKLGADAAIRKPFNRSELLDLIEYCLNNRS